MSCSFRDASYMVMCKPVTECALQQYARQVGGWVTRAAAEVAFALMRSLSADGLTDDAKQEERRPQARLGDEGAGGLASVEGHEGNCSGGDNDGSQLRTKMLSSLVTGRVSARRHVTAALPR